MKLFYPQEVRRGRRRAAHPQMQEHQKQQAMTTLDTPKLFSTLEQLAICSDISDVLSNLYVLYTRAYCKEAQASGVKATYKLD